MNSCLDINFTNYMTTLYILIELPYIFNYILYQIMRRNATTKILNLWKSYLTDIKYTSFYFARAKLHFEIVVGFVLESL